MLLDRFDRKSDIVSLGTNAMMNFPAVKSLHDIVQLRELVDVFACNTRLIQYTGTEIDTFSPILIQILLQKVPCEIVRDWTRQPLSHQMPFSELLDFVDRTVLAEERVKEQQNNSRPTQEHNKQKSKSVISTPSALAVHVKSSRPCRFCSDPGYRPSSCKKLNLHERIQFANDHDLCHLCLRPGHKVTNCNSGYKNCPVCRTGLHHAALCTEKWDIKVKLFRSNKDEYCTAAVTGTGSNKIFCPTATASIEGSKGISVGVVLFDNGSHRNFIRRGVAEKIGAEVEAVEKIAVGIFGRKKNRTGPVPKSSTIQVTRIATWRSSHWNCRPWTRGNMCPATNSHLWTGSRTVNKSSWTSRSSK